MSQKTIAAIDYALSIPGVNSADLVATLLHIRCSLTPGRTRSSSRAHAREALDLIQRLTPSDARRVSGLLNLSALKSPLASSR